MSQTEIKGSAMPCALCCLVVDFNLDIMVIYSPYSHH